MSNITSTENEIKVLEHLNLTQKHNDLLDFPADNNNNNIRADEEKTMLELDGPLPTLNSIVFNLVQENKLNNNSLNDLANDGEADFTAIKHLQSSQTLDSMK
jgi:hypothetical protein